MRHESPLKKSGNGAAPPKIVGLWAESKSR